MPYRGKTRNRIDHVAYLNQIEEEKDVAPLGLTDKDIVGQLIGGASLRTYMIPDGSIPSNSPEHIETYALPHIVIQGDAFWAKSESVHITYYFGDKTHPPCAFCYTNIGDIFCSFTPTCNRGVLMSKKRYRVHEWHLKDNYRLVWDSKKGDSAEIVKKEIERCAKMKIAMLDTEDIWNIHPIELPMYYPEEGMFTLNSAGDPYPIFFRDRETTLGLLQKYAPFFNTKPSDNLSGLMEFNMEAFCSFYVFRSDGTYFNYYDIPRGTIQPYKRLKVFVEEA